MAASRAGDSGSRTIRLKLSHRLYQLKAPPCLTNRPRSKTYKATHNSSLIRIKELHKLSLRLLSVTTQSVLEFCPIHCPNGRLGQDLGFGGFAFALKLPQLLNRNLAAVRAKLGQTSCFPNGPQSWCPIGQ